MVSRYNKPSKRDNNTWAPVTSFRVIAPSWGVMCLGNLMCNLKNSIMALAAPAKVQQSLFPDHVHVGDELVIEFGECVNDLRISTFTPVQLSSIEKLDTFILQNSGKEHASLYLNAESLYADPRWDNIRLLAKEVAKEMGWPITTPKKDTHNVVSGT